MTTDEDFRQTVIDYFNIEAQRYENIMAAIADLKTAVEATKVEFDAIIAEFAKLKTSTHDALAVLKDTAAAGHSAIMDEAIADQTKLLAMAKDVHTMVTDTSSEIKAAIATTPLPGQILGPQ